MLGQAPPGVFAELLKQSNEEENAAEEQGEEALWGGCPDSSNMRLVLTAL